MGTLQGGPTFASEHIGTLKGGPTFASEHTWKFKVVQHLYINIYI